MKIAVGSDHAGLALKREVLETLKAAGHEPVDVGAFSGDSVDYPDFAAMVAGQVAGGQAAQGVLVCGTGIGMSIAANKVAGVRAAVATNELMARMARAHNDANVLCLGERLVGPGLARAIVEAWLATPFEGGRHQRRVEKINAAEKK